MLKNTKGNWVTIEFGEGQTKAFKAGGKCRYLIDKSEHNSFRFGEDHGFVAVNATIKFANGSKHYGIVLLDEESSGEHCGTLVFKKGGGLVQQGDEDFCTALGLTSDQVFPYKYKYATAIHCNDHHVGEDGWSR